ncbi:DUF2599 domain-containing protein [Clostridium tetani]|uniref:DUF2599 domain-containing protein n=1 Tax=Clostridium tetani TaxID=1513 RepID=UPI000513A585|nr:DUF2599 domain-containing protein [Clostridium tetani]KGI42912.1 hypothetical protein KY55_08330 [Clostridium tetani]RXI67533.1 DUF2599 domain-containing protein [Clostridium tetani]BDR76984.1 hypothetical protein K154306013_p10350 [Clostridium tetani]BDR88116.1 hypothetical protein N071400001_p10510 [Clostridium tetani]
MKKTIKLSILLLILTFLFPSTSVNASKLSSHNETLKNPNKYDAKFGINFDDKLLQLHKEAIEIYGEEELLENWKTFNKAKKNNTTKNFNHPIALYNTNTPYNLSLNARSDKLTDYFYSVKWITRDGVVSLSIDPKPALYVVNMGDDRAEYERFLKAKKGWDIIVKQFSKDSRWKNTKIMEKQYLCHVGYGGIKRPWNIEPHRTSMNPMNCN